MAIITLPTQIDFIRWSSQLRLDLADYSIPIARSQEDWRSWAAQLLQQNPNFINVPLPTINSYPTSDDWRKWAIAFTQVIFQQ